MDPGTADQDRIEMFLMQVIKLERRYAFELRNVTKERRSELKDLVDSFSARELESDETEENSAE